MEEQNDSKPGFIHLETANGGIVFDIHIESHLWEEYVFALVETAAEILQSRGDPNAD